MSRYHMIDNIEAKGSYVNAKGFSSTNSSTSSPCTSPRLQHYSTGRGDPSFPDVDVHLGMIFGMNSNNVLEKDTRENAPQHHVDFERVHMRLQFLEDSNTVMQSRNQNLITENKALVNQLEEETKSINELKSQLQETRTELEREKEKNKTTKKNTGSAEFMDKIISTDGPNRTMERSAQCWAVCLACQKKLEGQEFDSEPTVTITKSELESLENDMQSLRDAVIAREEAWDKAMEREQNYRQQLARLSAETVTSRHLSESRNSELETLNVTLAEKEAELKATQKDLLSLKKIIVKMERRQRDLEENNDIENAELGSAATGLVAGTNVISEKDQKTVEDILRRPIHVKPNNKQRQRYKGISNSMPQSLQGSPRSPRCSF